MAVSDADIAFATDLFADLGGLTTRKMFGGICLYHDGIVFALMSAEGRLYLKVKGTIARQLQDDGAEQFHNMPYWSLPDDVLENPEAATDLARQALAVL